MLLKAYLSGTTTKGIKGDASPFAEDSKKLSFPFIPPAVVCLLRVCENAPLSNCSPASRLRFAWKTLVKRNVVYADDPSLAQPANDNLGAKGAVCRRFARLSGLLPTSIKLRGYVPAWAANLSYSFAGVPFPSNPVRATASNIVFFLSRPFERERVCVCLQVYAREDGGS